MLSRSPSSENSKEPQVAPEWIEKLEADLPPADHDDEDEDD
jgi:hypothetical protein